MRASGNIKKIVKVCFAGLVCGFLFACSANGDVVEYSGEYESLSNKSNVGDKDSLPAPDTLKTDSLRNDSLGMGYFTLIAISSSSVKHSSLEFAVDAFSITSTEISQGTFKKVMENIPKQPKSGDDYPVVNVSWFQAALFCNAISKKLGLDTAYKYEYLTDDYVMKNVTVDFHAQTVRLPTEMEWELAARAGTSTTYFWGTDVASKYAFYAQTNGPEKVATFKANAFGLYDMAGNVAEWVNDRYGTYPSKSQKNMTGPENGDFRCIRGGGWTDKVKQLASSERDKNVPSYKSETLGFRVVYSKGF